MENIETGSIYLYSELSLTPHFLALQLISGSPVYPLRPGLPVYADSPESLDYGTTLFLRHMASSD